VRGRAPHPACYLVEYLFQADLGRCYDVVGLACLVWLKAAPGDAGTLSGYAGTLSVQAETAGHLCRFAEKVSESLLRAHRVCARVLAANGSHRLVLSKDSLHRLLLVCVVQEVREGAGVGDGSRACPCTSPGLLLR
jgi:hypothetical protein